MKRFLAISSAFLALAACAPEYETDNLPIEILPEPEITYEGSGNLLFNPGDGIQTPHTYSWKAEGTAITINVNVNSQYYLEGDKEAGVDGKGWQIGYFSLPKASIGEFLGGISVTSELDESTFYGIQPDGSKVETMTSYKPGMWVALDGSSCGWGDGRMFWQWYVWGGKTDKGGAEISYDYDYKENPEIIYIGTNPGNITDALGKTVTSKAQILVGEVTYDFIVNVKYSASEIPEDPEDETEGYPEGTADAGFGYTYGGGVYGDHQINWYFDEDGLNVDVDAVGSIEEWGFAGVVIPTDIVASYLEIEDISQLADIGFFYPLQADGTPYVDAESGAAKWTSYAPGQWVDQEGNATNWSGGYMFWQYQFGDNKYEGHSTEGLLVIGTNPDNAAALEDGAVVTSKAQLGDKLLTVSVTFHKEYPTSKTGKVGPYTYSWTLGDESMDVVANVSLASMDDTWGWMGFVLNEAYVNARYGIDIDSFDIASFYPVAPDGTPYEKWTSYAPGEWFNTDGTAGSWDTACAFWQYYTSKEYDFPIPNLFYVGKNPGTEVPAGTKAVSKAKLGDKDFTFTINVNE